MSSVPHSDDSALPQQPTQIVSTHSLPSAPVPPSHPTILLGSFLNLGDKASLANPCTSSSLAGPLSPAATMFAEAPLHKLMEMDPEAMDPKDLPAYVDRLNQLRKAPQTLAAKVRQDAEQLTLKHGEDDAERLRKKAEGAIKRKASGNSLATAKKAEELGNKYC